MNTIANKFLRLLFVGVIFTVFVVGAVICVPKFRQAASLNARKAAIEQRIADTRREINSVREQKERFERDRDFVESLARQNRRVFPGEVVFVFDD